ncbi:hypothetical protein OM076_22870 [Solirubrobacter ginsenosidimutans]|uniref:Sigma-70 family RNA polymerase sigma factor n=1 Tax=Solirubrobacter ginsenosidimutans TaxID=490573 RepID=A0A9X3MV82_9ACTN|nr:hypothetical protein [Solirubrobacter ginsenosidimutans]MDA0163135.1 hypothetical protein [Solirubrobacter ginsenosidimutans]
MTTTEATRERRQALAAFYDAHQRSLQRLVHIKAGGAGAEAVLDACAFAWLTLVRRTDVTLDDRGFGWLATVAMHEAWRTKRDCREVPCGTFATRCEDDRELTDPPSLASDPLDRVLAAELHRERVARFAELIASERRDLLLLAGGYRYREIATLTASTYTAVNHRITRGRARLRDASAS